MSRDAWDVPSPDDEAQEEWMERWRYIGLWAILISVGWLAVVGMACTISFFYHLVVR